MSEVPLYSPPAPGGWGAKPPTTHLPTIHICACFKRPAFWTDVPFHLMALRRAQLGSDEDLARVVRVVHSGRSTCRAISGPNLVQRLFLTNLSKMLTGLTNLSKMMTDLHLR